MGTRRDGGFRVQVHVLEDGSVQIYSRNLENTTAKYPDIVARMATALAPGTKSIVLDCEAQAWDPEKKVFLPFQVLTTRKRKDVKEEDVTVQARRLALRSILIGTRAGVPVACSVLVRLYVCGACMRGARTAWWLLCQSGARAKDCSCAAAACAHDLCSASCIAPHAAAGCATTTRL